MNKMNDKDFIDPITLEVIREGLISTVREMRITMTRIAYSSVLHEARDFSCALFDKDGQTIAQSEDLPGHVIPLPWIVRTVIEKYKGDINPGDLFIVNDPYVGGTHLPDVTIVYPIFIEGEMILFPSMRAHWADVGGMTPGSISGRATEIYQEGIRIPPVKLYIKGEPNQAVMDILFNNMRLPDQRRGDLRGMVGTCRMAEKRIREVVEKYGKENLKKYMQVILDRSEERMRNAIREIPDGEYFYEDYLDMSGSSLDPVIIKLKLTKEGDNLTADFTGSSHWVPGPVNASLAVTTSGVFIVIKSAIDPAGAVNSGTFRPITVTAPEGTILNAVPPAPTGAFSEIRRRVSSVTLGALIKAIPDMLAGDVKGTANHTYIGGYDPRNGKSYVYYEYPHGGVGGFKGGDGSHTLACYNSGDCSSIQPVESLELEFPFLFTRCELRKNSCGDGRWRGGLGMRREVNMHISDGFLSVVSDRNIVPPFGILGGYSGYGNRFVVKRGGELVEPSPFPGKITNFHLLKGDTLLELSNGGGGYGDPLERDPELVLKDYIEGLITIDRVEKRYGVVIEDGKVNYEKTTKLREEIKNSRKWFPIVEQKDNEYEKGKRICKINPNDAKKLGFKDNDLIEYLSESGIPLRAWISIDERVEEGKLPLGEMGRKILRINEKDKVSLRKVETGREEKVL